jgi:catechol 2,3-dioxygenase-like lactoylglutathione lyase family enzyme
MGELLPRLARLANRCCLIRSMSHGAGDHEGGMHVCLRAPGDEAVRTFHALALEHGGTSDGAPGPRQGAITVYYGAFIKDPDGNKIEAVTFGRP